MSISENRKSQASVSIEKLAQREDLITYISDIHDLLETDDDDWACILRLRKSPRAAARLRRRLLPQLYDIPDEMMSLMEDIRAGPAWENVKEFAIKRITDGLVSQSSRPSSQRWSNRSSNSAFSTRSNYSYPLTPSSNRSSIPVSMSQDVTGQSSPFGEARDEDFHAATPSFGGPTTLTPLFPPIDENSRQCHLQGCPHYGKTFKHQKPFENHMLTKHGYVVPPTYQTSHHDNDVQTDQVHQSGPRSQSTYIAKDNEMYQGGSQAMPQSSYERELPSTRLESMPNAERPANTSSYPFPTSQVKGMNYYGNTGLKIINSDVAALTSGSQMHIQGTYVHHDEYHDSNMTDVAYNSSAVKAATGLALQSNRYQHIGSGLYNPNSCGYA